MATWQTLPAVVSLFPVETEERNIRRAAEENDHGEQALAASFVVGKRGKKDGGSPRG
jgi:hypothetical protein